MGIIIIPLYPANNQCFFFPLLRWFGPTWAKKTARGVHTVATRKSPRDLLHVFLQHPFSGATFREGKSRKTNMAAENISNYSPENLSKMTTEINIFNRIYIFKWFGFHCHVSSRRCKKPQLNLCMGHVSVENHLGVFLCFTGIPVFPLHKRGTKNSPTNNSENTTPCSSLQKWIASSQKQI